MESAVGAEVEDDDELLAVLLLEELAALLELELEEEAGALEELAALLDVLLLVVELELERLDDEVLETELEAALLELPEGVLVTELELLVDVAELELLNALEEEPVDVELEESPDPPSSAAAASLVRLVSEQAALINMAPSSAVRKRNGA